MFNRLMPIMLAVLMPVNCVAENRALIYLVGGEPGQPLTYAYSRGVPQDGRQEFVLRTVVRQEVLETIFPDVLMTVRSADKIVTNISAQRAYLTARDCEAARKTTAGLLAAVLANDYAGSDSRWDMQSPDGAVVASVRCNKERFETHPVLTLEISTR